MTVASRGEREAAALVRALDDRLSREVQRLHDIAARGSERAEERMRRLEASVQGQVRTLQDRSTEEHRRTREEMRRIHRSFISESWSILALTMSLFVTMTIFTLAAHDAAGGS